MARPKMKSKTQRARRHQARMRKTEERQGQGERIGIYTGMSQWEVRSHLGEPHASTTMESFLKSYQVVHLRGRIPNSESWMYYDYPKPGTNTMITFEQGVVSNVLTR